MVLFAAAFALLFVFWLLLSGFFTPFLLAAGVGSAIAVVLLARRMGVADLEAFPLVMWKATYRYWPWLLMEIVKSGVGRDPDHPRSAAADQPRRSCASGPASAPTSGSSSTPTRSRSRPARSPSRSAPGEFLVHALTREGAAGLVGSEMDRRVADLEGAR